MAYHGYDPGDRNNWYQSPHLGLSPVRPAVYGSGIYGGCYNTHTSHPYGSPSYPPPPSQFPLQPSYPPPPPPSQTIINGHLLPHQFPSTHSYHSPRFDPIPWIYPSISQRHSYDPSVTSVHSQFIFTKTMNPPPIYHSAPSFPTFQSPSISTFVPQFTDLKPLSLHSKPFRGFNRRVAMGAKARVAKKTRNPDLLREVVCRLPETPRRLQFWQRMIHTTLLPITSPKVAHQVFDEKPAMETLAPTTEDEEIIKVVVAGTIPSYSVESKLGDCKRVASIRCKSLEGFD
ncbi:putative hydroxymethylglutaryl-CoA reductase (NADPH) [Rosa chinensis]|uniref:Putative hydroxymethylglutaryl-CoA reductase (NADPH) n=1 Tax=Rosa chinensis TaxID=74649 RepID=A0A2P6QQZ9_ROSCH|nr:putative hydroxymethylglutaryl-CoA reductase (NADPH) [Rosa chinensis]